MVKDIDAYSGIYGSIGSPNDDDKNNFINIIIYWYPIIFFIVGLILVIVYGKKISNKSDSNYNSYVGAVSVGSVLIVIGVVVLGLRFIY
jgi:preprotein translocase subunit SecG